MPLSPVTTLQKLVSLPSVNPMGMPVEGPIYRESRMTAYLQSIFETLDLPWRRDTVEPERDNIVIRLDGDRPGLCVWEVHQDTVPVEGMTIDPFGGELRDGRIWGRGACDIKGGMAAMLAAFVRLAEERPQGRPTIVLACTVNEEYGFTGAQALVNLWQSQPGSIIPRQPDVCIVAEPTLLDVVVAHRGIVRWRCHTHGRAAHSSQPDHGDNAIYKMMGVARAFQRYHQEVTPTLPGHRLCGQPTVCVSTIAGGVSVNTGGQLGLRLIAGWFKHSRGLSTILKYITQQTSVGASRARRPTSRFKVCPARTTARRPTLCWRGAPSRAGREQGGRAVWNRRFGHRQVGCADGRLRPWVDRASPHG